MGSKSEKVLRCAIYTRKSTEHGLELEFNSLDAQRAACEAYIKSQASQGWQPENLRREIGFICGRHSAIQHHNLDGPTDTQCAFVLCPIRAQVSVGACARQDRRFA
jgi:hypothetical protein